MGGKAEKKQETEQTSTSTRNPYAPAEPVLRDILSQASGMAGQTGLTGAEQGALTGLGQTGQAAAGYAPQVQGLLNQVISGQGAAGQAADTVSGALNPIVSGNYLDPASNPYLSPAIEQAQEAARNQVTARFSAGGRNFSPSESRALGQGITDATVPHLFNQYNTEANRQLQAAGLLNQTGLNAQTAQLQGVSMAPNLTALEQQPFRAQLEASGLERGIPQQQLGLLSNLVLPIASGFGTTEGESQGTTVNTQTDNPWQTAVGAGIAGLGLLSGNPMMAMGGMGGMGGGGPSAGPQFFNQNMLPWR